MTGGDGQDLLQAFAALNRSDRAAIAKRLSPHQRRLLRALHPKPKAGAALEAAPLAWPNYSPPLARHILRLIAEAEAGSSKLTPHAQAALHACLAPRFDTSRPAVPTGGRP